jgi:hypothetical protein
MKDDPLKEPCYWAAVVVPGLALALVGVLAHFVFSPYRGHHAVWVLKMCLVVGWVPSMLATGFIVHQRYRRTSDPAYKERAEWYTVAAVVCSGLTAVACCALGRLAMSVLKPEMYP